MKKYFLLIITIIVFALLLCSCGVMKDKAERQLESLEKEYAQKKPGFVLHGNFKYNGVGFFLESLVEEKTKTTPGSVVAYAIYKDELYLSYSCSSNDIEKPIKWVLAKYNFSTAELITVYEEDTYSATNIRLVDSTAGKGVILVKDTIYLKMPFDVVSYSIRTGEINRTTILDLKITEKYIVHKENETFIVNDSNREKYEITYSDLVAKSPMAEKLSELENYKIWNRKNSIDKEISFVQPEEQAIFVIDSILNKLGHSYAVVYAYNPKEDTYEYVNYYYVDDVVTKSNFYVVPIID